MNSEKYKLLVAYYIIYNLDITGRENIICHEFDLTRRIVNNEVKEILSWPPSKGAVVRFTWMKFV